jgi:hypothetical protein
MLDQMCALAHSTESVSVMILQHLVEQKNSIRKKTWSIEDGGATRVSVAELEGSSVHIGALDDIDMSGLALRAFLPALNSTATRIRNRPLTTCIKTISDFTDF